MVDLDSGETLVEINDSQIIEIPNFPQVEEGKYFGKELYLQNSAYRTMDIRVYPYGKRHKNFVRILFKKRWLRLFPLAFKCIISVMDVNGDRKKTQTCVSDDLDSDIDIEHYVERSALFDEDFELLPKGTLTILCEVSYAIFSGQSGAKVWSLLSRMGDTFAEQQVNPFSSREKKDTENKEEMCELVFETMDGDQFIFPTPLSYFQVEENEYSPFLEASKSDKVTGASHRKASRAIIMTEDASDALNSISSKSETDFLFEQGNEEHFDKGISNPLLEQRCFKGKFSSNTETKLPEIIKMSKEVISTVLSASSKNETPKRALNTSIDFRNYTSASSTNLATDYRNETLESASDLCTNSTNEELKSTLDDSIHSKKDISKGGANFAAGYRNETLKSALSSKNEVSNSASGTKQKSKKEADITASRKRVNVLSMRKINGSDICDASPVFTRMLRSPMLENATKTIQLPDVDTDTFDSFLYYLETHQINAGSFSNLCNLYEMADKFLIPNLRDECVQKLVQSAEARNILELLEMADRHCDETLQNELYKFFSKNEKDIHHALQKDSAFVEWYDQVWTKQNIASTCVGIEKEINMDMYLS
ncbi:BTB domain-containing protein [Trichonephila clavata]|uniref:BTB domain-containing protein n=1 Tax=Trichonephila clavata TaxID=2740835 RepID=A0A8X6H9U9_TRICU|nr:BTB domain-containing protein [Trichonephila clavata]